MKLDYRNTNTLWCSVLAETLHRSGVRHAIVSPGSRSTPLIFALAAHPGIETIPILDERSASFFALGIAKQSAPPRPVALVCTSGTAAANYFPAIIEAQESAAPLLVITADRPPEMRECASGQTIDQQKLYGSHVNWYHELAVPDATPERLRYLRQTIAHACARATAPAPGPVHLNAPFRDPLPPMEDGTAKKLRGKITEQFFAHLSGAAFAFMECGDLSPLSTAGLVTPPRVTSCGPASQPVKSGDKSPHSIKNARAPRAISALIIAGPGSQAGDALQLAQRTGFPLLADALSPARHTPVPKTTVRVTAYDAILRNPRAARALAPDYVLCLGAWPTSKVLRAWLDKTQPEILMLSPTTRNLDALHGRTTTHLLADTGSFQLSGLQAFRPSDLSYRAAWQHAETTARASLDHTLANIADTDLFEPRAAWLLAQHLPDRTPVHIANSMPVRDAEYFWPPTTRAHRLHFNRGANGIDGTLSTALGLAHASEQPAVLLTGDLSLLHDTNGFLQAQSSKQRGSLTIVLINNNGGGIFEHLPVARFDPPYEEYIATPQHIDFAKLCATYNVEHTLIETWSQFTKLISPGALPARGVRLLEIRADRKRDTPRRKTLLAQALPA